jgi:hypothetical protein
MARIAKDCLPGVFSLLIDAFAKVDGRSRRRQGIRAAVRLTEIGKAVVTKVVLNHSRIVRLL